MVNLVDKAGDQNDVARAFGCAVRTLRDSSGPLKAAGWAALGHTKGDPRGRAAWPIRGADWCTGSNQGHSM